MKKFTFKTIKSTGRYRTFYPDEYQIRLNGIHVGNIYSKGTLEWIKYKIHLRIIKDENNTDKHINCPWMWIWFKKDFSSLEEAKQFIRDNNNLIQTQFKIPTE